VAGTGPATLTKLYFEEIDMSNQQAPVGASVAYDKVEKQFQSIEFARIKLDLEGYAFREPSEYEAEDIEALAEDIAQRGILTPLLTQALPGGDYLAVDCYRRVHAILHNIRNGVQGFDKDLIVPSYVILGEAHEAAVVIQGLVANVKRRDLGDIGLLRAATRLKRMAVPVADIAYSMGKSEATVNRYLLVGLNPTWFDHVREGNVTTTVAATLLKAAKDAGRQDELDEAFSVWLDQTWQKIYAEEEGRLTNDEESLSLIQKMPKKYLRPEQVAAWIESLRAGSPLGEPRFRYKAMIRKGSGPRRLEVDSISKALDEMSLEELVKVVGKYADLIPDLKEVIREKVAAREQATSDTDDVGKDRPSFELLRELGLEHMLADVEEDEASDDVEPADEEGDQIAGDRGNEPPSVDPIATPENPRPAPVDVVDIIEGRAGPLSGQKPRA